MRAKEYQLLENLKKEKKQQKCYIMSSHNTVASSSVNWSPWLDFDEANIDTVPKESGVYKVHASMKVLYIGSGQNLRQSLLESLADRCISKAKRFSYLISANSSPDIIKEELLNDYKHKHNGKLPSCMEEK